MRARIAWSVFAAAALAFALAGDQGAAIATRAASLGLAIASLVVLTGWSGQLNLHVAAIGLGWGAYAAAGLATNGVPSLIAIVLAPVVVLPAALVVGLLAVRFRGIELAIATLAAGLAFEQMAFQNLGKWLGRATSGTQFQSSLVELARPGGFEGDTAFALLALGIAAVWIRVAARAGSGRSGRIIAAVRDREVVAEARGVPVFAWRVAAFVFSSMLAAAGGAIAAAQTGAITPDSFRLTLSLQLLAVTLLAGARRLEAAAIGAAIIVLAQEAAGLPGLRWITGDRIDLLFGIGLIAALALQARRRIAGAGPSPDGASAATRSGARTASGGDEPATPPFGETVLRVSDVRVAFGGNEILRGADIRVGRGEVVGLVGGNGAGKTTLFDCVTGLVTPDAGRVFFEGTDVTEMRPHRRAHLGLARTFQTVEVFEGLSVLDGVLVSAGLREGRDARERARAALQEVGIDHLADADPATLPFATLRLVEIANALVADPSLVLLDEPLAGLDADERAVVLAEIRGLRERGRSVLIVEHDRDAVASVADRTYVLAEGRAREHAAAKEVRVAARV